MTELQITEGTVPDKAVNRTARPNPFQGRFPTAEGKSLVVTLPSSTDEEKREVNAVANLAQTAARNAGYTGRVKRDEVPVKVKGKDVPHTRLTIWSIPKITHKPKDEAAAPATPDTATN